MEGFAGDSGRTGRRGWIIALLLLLVGGAFVLLSSTPDSDPEIPAPAPEARTPEASPTLIGAPAPVSAPEPAPKKRSEDPPPPATTAADRDASWHIDFRVEGAEHWQRATFLSSVPGRAPVRTSRQHRMGAEGSIEVVGPGTLVVHAEQRIPWRSDVLTRPASGRLEVVAQMAPGLAIEGILLASDGRTSVEVGHVGATKAARLPDQPYSQPFSAWTKTDARGRFRLTGFHPGPVTLRAWSANKEQGARIDVEVQAGAEDVELHLKPVGILRLRVLDVDTEKAPKTTSLQVFYTTPKQTPGMTVRTSHPDHEPGEPFVLELKVVLGEPTDIRLQANGYLGFETTVEFPPEGGIQEVDAALQPDGRGEANLSVEVEFEDGKDRGAVGVMRYRGHLGFGGPETLQGGQLELRVAAGTTRVVIGESREGLFLPVPIAIDAAMTEPGAHTRRTVVLRQGGRLWFKQRPPHHKATFMQGGDAREVRIRRRRRGASSPVLAPGFWTWRIEGDTEIWRGEAQIKAGQLTDATWKVEKKPLGAPPAGK